MTFSTCAGRLDLPFHGYILTRAASGRTASSAKINRDGESPDVQAMEPAAFPFSLLLCCAGVNRLHPLREQQHDLNGRQHQFVFVLQ
jgi:hypothetical protein